MVLPAVVERDAKALWGERVARFYGDSIESLLKAGRALLEAKAALPHGEWQDFVENYTRFSHDAAMRLMRVAGHALISKPENFQVLPTAIGTLDSLTRLDDQTFQRAIEARVISPELRGRTATRLARGGLEAVIGAGDAAPPARTRGSRADAVEAESEKREEQLAYGETLWRALFDPATPAKPALALELRAVIVAAARWFGVGVDDLFATDRIEQGPLRTRAHAARRAATYLLHTRCGLAQPKAGAVFGLEPSAVSRLAATHEDYREMAFWDDTLNLIEQGADLLLRHAGAEDA